MGVLIPEARSSVRRLLGLLVAGSLLAIAAQAQAQVPAPATPVLEWAPCTDGAPAPLQCATALGAAGLPQPVGRKISRRSGAIPPRIPLTASAACS